MNLDLSGLVAVVTGASRGIGAAAARALAAQGADVALVARTESALSALAGEIEKQGVKAKVYPVDVAEPEAAQETIQDVRQSLGGVHVLVNNAGITRDQIIPRLSLEDWDEVIRVNLRSVFLWTKAVSRVMMKQRSGSIINISSIIGLTGNAGQSNYAASKAGIIAFTKSAAKEFGSRGIRVNAVAPGFVETDMTEGLGEEIRAKSAEQIPLGRWGRPEDIAQSVVFLASNCADYMTGQVLQIDGGLAMHG